MVVLHAVQRGALLGFAIDIFLHDVGVTDDIHDRLLPIVQLVPLVHVDQDFAEGRRLVPTGEVVVLGDLVEAEGFVDGRHRELGRINGAKLQRRIDVATGQKLGRNADLLHDTGAKAEEAHFHALKVGDLLHRLPEPAGGFRRDHAADTAVNVLRRHHLLIDFMAAAMEHPGIVFAEAGAERHRGEEAIGRVLAHVIAGAAPGAVKRAGGDRIEILHARHQRARLEESHADRVFADVRDIFSNAHTCRAEDRNLRTERRVHFPAVTRVIRIGGADGAKRHNGGERASHKGFHYHLGSSSSEPFLDRWHRAYPGTATPTGSAKEPSRRGVTMPFWAASGKAMFRTANKFPRKSAAAHRKAGRQR